MKVVVRLLWFMACVGAWVLICNHFLWSDDVYKGTDIHLSLGVDDTILIKGKNVKFEGGSCSPFALYSATEAVASVPSTEPLGSNCGQYHHAVHDSISPGKWILASGQPEVRLTSPNEIDAVVYGSVEAKILLSILSFLVAALVFVLGYSFQDEVLDIPDGWPAWIVDRKRTKSSSSSDYHR